MRVSLPAATFWVIESDQVICTTNCREHLHFIFDYLVNDSWHFGRREDNTKLRANLKEVEFSFRVIDSLQWLYRNED